MGRMQRSYARQSVGVSHAALVAGYASTQFHQRLAPDRSNESLRPKTFRLTGRRDLNYRVKLSTFPPMRRQSLSFFAADFKD